MIFSRNEFQKRTEEGHTPEFIKIAIEYAENLHHKGLPVIFSTRHLSQLLNIEYGDFLKLIRCREGYYKYYVIKKKHGGKRRIVVPYNNLKMIQRWINKKILQKVVFKEYVTGFVPQRSILSNAKIHQQAKYVSKYDMKDFFESINERRVYGIFHGLGYAKNLSIDLARLCTTLISEYKWENMSDEEQQAFLQLKDKKEAFLVQGAPTSPTLANLCSRHLDNRLSAWALKAGVHYSRYADDITFSSNDKGKLPKSLFVKKIVEEEKFQLNQEKTRMICEGSGLSITGILVDYNKIRLSRKYKKDIYKHLYYCEKYGARNHFARVAPNKQHCREWLYGKILYINAIEPDVAKEMMERANKIDWGI